MSKLERVILTIDRLIFEKKIKSRKELAEKLEYTESSLSQIINGKVALSDKFIKKLANFDLVINEEWLMTGEGDMLKGVREADTDEPGREGCNCPFTSSMSEIIETMKSICDVNKKLVDQQSELIAVIKILSENK